MLAFSRRQRLSARPTDLNALLRELITLATSTLGRRVQVSTELADDLWPAMVDPSQVEAAILNLCLNARDAMPEGGRLTIRTANLVLEAGWRPGMPTTSFRPATMCRCSISDTGTGMSPEVKARAFDPFFTTKGPGAGSGLGLSQVYGMARRNPAARFDRQHARARERASPCPCRARRRRRHRNGAAEEPLGLAHARACRANSLLVVDDDAAVRQVTVEMMHDLGCEVVQAAGGEQALALVDKLSPLPEVILLDYAMPGMNGLQLARALRDRGINAPIALVTGYAELSEAEIATEQLGGLLRKPFTIRELQGLLTQLRAAAPCLEPGLAVP